jgi:hypothetical protein
MGFKRRQKRKLWHLSGYIVPEARKPKSILKDKRLMKRIKKLYDSSLEWVYEFN